LAGRVDLDGFDSRLASWLKRGLSADPGDRFADAERMRASWRSVAAAIARDERRSATGVRKLLKRVGAALRPGPRT
jgi:hypothetical protein